MKQTELDKKLEQVVNDLEDPETMTSEILEGLKQDNEKLQAAKDWFALRQTLAYTNSIFCETESSKPIRHHRSSKNKSRWVVICTLLGAAVIACVFVLEIYRVESQVSGESNGRQVLAVIPMTDDVTLSTGNGVTVDLNTTANIEKLDISKMDERSIVYERTTSSKVEMHTLTVPRGRDYQVTLSDGTKVWLNAESKLTYPSLFLDAKREVNLEGEAYFEVAANKDKPFIVHTPKVNTTVYGTEFNVDAYDTALPRVTLINGIVQVSDIQGDNEIHLTPGDEVVLLETGTFACKKVDVDSYIYWRDGYFYFDEMPMEKIMCDIGRWHNLNVCFLNTAVMNEKIHFVMKRSMDIQYLIAFVNKLGKCKVSLEKDTLVVR